MLFPATGFDGFDAPDQIPAGGLGAVSQVVDFLLLDGPDNLPVLLRVAQELVRHSTSLIQCVQLQLTAQLGTELIQGTTDYRSSDMLDLVADSLGLMTGCVTVTVIKSFGGKW